jgi:predicted secreted protein
LSLISDKYAGPSPSASPLMGAGGARTWVVRVDDAGTLTLTGIYARPWEAPTKSAASFSLTIEAR